EGAVAHIKGAPDILIGECNYIMDGAAVRPITKEDIEAIHSANHAMATKALRVLGIAIKTGELDVKTIEKDMVFVGLVGMIDPPRAEVKDAVAVCKKAGMQAIMITGDHMDTARAIASEIGILSDDGLTITGAELDKLSDEEFLANVGRYYVYARVSPQNKVRIVKTFQAAGKKVAMTGDGVNDAPSIKSADIGIGMGITGTDVSKGASDMVLADDNFATIVHAVEEGRKVYSNIKKAVQYLLSANIAEVLCVFIATVFLKMPFLTPIMILWVNLVTDSLPALALGTEKAEPDIMNYPPRKSSASLFSGKTGKNIIIQGIMQTGLVLASFLIGHYVLSGNPDATDPEAMTMAFITLCMIQLFHSYNMRSSHSLFSSNPLENRFLNLSFLICSALLIMVIVIPGVGPTVFGTAEKLSGAEWAIALGISVIIIPLVEAQKAIEKLIANFKAKKA
ncbi:MAG: cation-translocating P-type ATPase, partial [Clostridia bacterium]